MRIRRIAEGALALALTQTAGSVSGQGLALDTVEWVTGLTQPVALVDAGDGSGRLFVVQQAGEIRIWDGDQLLSEPFLDLSAATTCCDERGLLGLTFHPDYADNGELFVNYTRTVAGQLETVIARYTASAEDPDLADPASEEILLTYEQPFGNHNGGQLAFGPDGFLYLSSGDGGGGGDPNENAQALDTLLGKLLRIDVDATDPGLAYAIPPDNPFVGVAGARGEIWAYGLRNPWRFSFDRRTGDVWIADVGQASWEEVDLQPAASPGGENYGWDCFEGTHPFESTDCPADGFTDPVLEYSSQSGTGRCSVTGGFRYRGDGEPRLRGVYLFADFCSGEILGTVPRCDGAWQSEVLLDTAFLIASFGEDEAGELSVTEYVGGNPAPATSRVHRLVLAPGSGGPDLAVTPDPLDFGEVEAGDTVEAVLTLSNVNGGPESLTVLSTTLSDELPFTVDPSGGPSPCQTLTPCLAPGASCTVGVTLKVDAPASLDEGLAFDGNFATEVAPLLAEIVPCSSELDLTLSNRLVDGTESHHACDTLTAGPGVTVGATGELTLCGGTRVAIGGDFAVESGGRLTISTDC